MLLVYFLLIFLEDNSDGSVGTNNKNKLEARIKALERGVAGASLKLSDKTGKKIEKYAPNKFNKGEFNTDAEVQLSKKKIARDESDSEEEVVVKKSKKKAKVEEDSD